MNPEKAKEILSRMRQIEDPHEPPGERHAGRPVPLRLQRPGHGLRRGARILPGDEVRTIDWNVTARSGHPFVKKFIEERELTIMLLVDVSASGNFGSAAQSKRELAAEIASVLAFSAIRNNDKVGLILFTDQVEQYIPPRKGRRHVLRVVREILFLQPRRPRHGQRQGARLRESRAAPARDRVPDFGFPVAGRSRAAPSPTCAGPCGRPTAATTWSRCMSQDPREKVTPGCRHARDRRRRDRRTHRARYRRPAVRARFESSAIERAQRLVHGFRAEGDRHPGAEHRHAYLPALQRFFKTRERRR